MNPTKTSPLTHLNKPFSSHACFVNIIIYIDQTQSFLEKNHMQRCGSIEFTHRSIENLQAN